MSLALSIPAFTSLDSVEAWRPRYLAAVESLPVKQKVALLPNYINLTKGHQEVACLAAKEDTVEKAFAVLEGFLDKEKTSYERVCEFRENRDTQDCVKLFFQIKESGDKLGVHPRIIFLQFLSMFPDQGKRFFNGNAGSGTSECLKGCYQIRGKYGW